MREGEGSKKKREKENSPTTPSSPLTSLCFNDDIQGTGAVVCAGFLNGMRARGTPLSEARVAFFGAGSSAVGVAETIAAAVAADTTRREATRTEHREVIWPLRADRPGE